MADQASRASRGRGRAHDPPLEVGRAHAQRRENDQPIGHAWVVMQDDAAALAGRGAEQFEAATLAEQTARRRPASEYILACFPRQTLDLDGLEEFDCRVEVATALELGGLEQDPPGSSVVGGAGAMIEPLL